MGECCLLVAAVCLVGILLLGTCELGLLFVGLLCLHCVLGFFSLAKYVLVNLSFCVRLWQESGRGPGIGVLLVFLLFWLLPCGVSGRGARCVGDLPVGGPLGPGVPGVLGVLGVLLVSALCFLLPLPDFRCWWRKRY